MISASGRRLQAIERLRPWVERARTFSGWNFDFLNVRALEPEQPWDYVALVREYAADARRVVDFGTGGGEVYSRIIDGLPAQFVASEQWDVNAAVARDRLRPLGVDVIRGDSETPAFAGETFDIVLSRHEAIDPAEVARILRPGGVFITQQVAKEQWQELDSFFPRKTQWPDHYVEYAAAFEDAGCEVTTRGYHSWRAAYGGIEEVAFMLLVAPWEIPDFDPIAEIDALLALEDAHRTDDGIILTIARYLLVVRKPGLQSHA